MDDELRKAVAEYFRQQQPAKPHFPDAPGNPAGLSDKARDTAATLYGEAIMRKQPGQLTPEERDFLRQSIAAWSANRDEPR